MYYKSLILKSELHGCLDISLVDPLFEIGFIYLMLGKYKSSLEPFLQCLKVYKYFFKKETHIKMQEIHTVLGEVYKRL